MADELVTLTDGTNTVDFLSGEGATTGYVKQTIEGLDPPPLIVTASTGKPIYSSYDNREIVIAFGIIATDAADLTTKQTKIITILENTRLHWESKGGRGAKAQLQYRRPGGTNTSYIDVFWGECDWGRVEHQEGAAYAYSLKGAQLTLTCELCFHPSAVVNLVTDQSVFNHDDSGHDNYFDIAAANIEGDLPALCNIKIVSAADISPNDIDKFWIAMVGPKTDIKHWGEIGGSYDANRSNDDKWARRTSYDGWGRSAGVTGEGFVTFIPSYWGAMSGRTWRVVGGMYATSTDVEWKVEATTKAWVSGSEILIDLGKATYHPEASQWCLVDLGPLHISQVMAGDYPGAGLYIGWQYNVHGVDSTIQVDFLCLIPEHEYSAFIDKSASGLANYTFYYTNDRLYIKEAVDFPHHIFTQSATENIGCLGSSQRGVHPRLMPGVDNRIIFLFAELGDRHNITREFDVTIDYLPQYLCPLE